MTTFSRASEGPRPAGRVVELPPSAFADDWDKKPSEAMRVGLRLVGQGDIERARAASFQQAVELIPEPSQDRVDQFNDGIMRGILARATCMPDDARESFFPLPEDDVQAALTPEAVKLLWHEYDVLKLESCGYLREANDDELTELAAMLLSEEAWVALPSEKAKRLRRIALHVLEELDPELRG